MLHAVITTENILPHPAIFVVDSNGGDRMTELPTITSYATVSQSVNSSATS
jgi:hypothetical protein